MTKKDYQLLAQALVSAHGQLHGRLIGKPVQAAYDVAWRKCVDEIATSCRKENPAFKHSLFYAACGIVPKEALQGVRLMLNE